MSQNVYQFIDVNRVDPAKKPIKIRKIEFVEIYEPFTKQQAKAQADRCLDCGNPYCEWKCQFITTSLSGSSLPMRAHYRSG